MDGMKRIDAAVEDRQQAQQPEHRQQGDEQRQVGELERVGTKYAAPW